MLKSRLLSSLLLIGCALLFIGLDAWATRRGYPGLWLLPLGFYLVFGSAIECMLIVGRSSVGSVALPAALGAASVMLAGSVPILGPLMESAPSQDWTVASLEWPLLAATVAMFGSFAIGFRSFSPQSGSFLRSILSGWISCYFGICFSLAIAVRMEGNSHWGLFLLMGFILVTKLADTGAYFTGRALGRTKLCPAVSPNKTVEGLVGGALFATLGAYVYFGWLASANFGPGAGVTGWAGIMATGLGLTLVGLVGDLLESAFKREFGCKDSGHMLPGLGGLWDVTDSILPAMAAGYGIVRAGLIIGPTQ